MGAIKAFLTKKPVLVLLFGLVVLILALTYADRVTYAGSDPHHALLVSQAILEQGTIKLDAYRQRAQPPLDTYPPSGPLIRYNGHIYYYFPLGSSVFSLPFVALARWFGLDMAKLVDNHLMQDIISALLCAAATGLIYALCRVFVGAVASLAITATSVLGSGLVSIMGTALWNIDWAVLFGLGALILVARHLEGEKWSWHPYAVGFLLFAAYFCRASFAALIVPLFVLLLLQDWREWLKAAAVSGGLLLAFLAFSWYEFGSPFPQYYSLGRFAAYTVPLWAAIWGHLWSASRGLLVFSPFLLVVIWATIGSLSHLWRKQLFWVSCAWFALLLVAASRSTRWWGGHAFGSRLLTEGWPALILLTAMAWKAAQTHANRKAQALIATAYIVLGAVAIWINTYQGLYQVETASWNGGNMPPNVDHHPEYLFDWEYPQFLATQGDLCARNLEYGSWALSQNPYRLLPYQIGGEIRFDSGLEDPLGANREIYLRIFRPRNWENLLPTDRDGLREPSLDLASLPAGTEESGPENALFLGWSMPEGTYRWSQCPSARILFGLEASDPVQMYLLEVTSGSYGSQLVEVWLNGERLGQLAFPGPGVPPRVLGIPLPGELLQPGHYNELVFRLAGAVQASSTDPRLLGLSFVALRILPLP